MQLAWEGGRNWSWPPELAVVVSGINGWGGGLNVYMSQWVGPLCGLTAQWVWEALGGVSAMGVLLFVREDSTTLG